MFLAIIYIFPFVLVSISGQQSKLKVVQERGVMSTSEHEYADAYGTVYMYNRTNKALNVTFTLHKPLHEKDSTIKILFNKFLSNEYRPSGIAITEPIEKILQYKLFDLQKLFLEYTTPQLVWPLKTEVTYRMLGFDFDGSKFPPFFPSGKYKVSLVFETKKFKFAQFDWFMSLEPIY